MRYCHILPPTSCRNNFACCSFFCRHLLGTCSVFDIWACHSTTFFQENYGFNSPPGQQQQTCFNSRLVVSGAPSSKAGREAGQRAESRAVSTNPFLPMHRQERTDVHCRIVFLGVLQPSCSPPRHRGSRRGCTVQETCSKTCGLLFRTRSTSLLLFFDLLGLPMFFFLFQTARL